MPTETPAAETAQPPFKFGDVVRHESGLIINVASCVRVVAHSHLLWAVYDTNGNRVWAKNCRLATPLDLPIREHEKLTNAPLVSVVKEPDGKLLTDPLGTIKLGKSESHVGSFGFEPGTINDQGAFVGISAVNGAAVHAEQTAAELKAEIESLAAQRDEAANKAAAEIVQRAAESLVFLSKDWISDAISAQIRPGVLELYKKLQHRRCDTCGANTIDGCTRCGAPQCCPQCCKIDEREATIEELRADLKAFKSFCPECGSIDLVKCAEPTEPGHHYCASCDQELFKRVSYHEAIASNLSSRAALKERLTIALSLLANTETKYFTFHGVELRRTSDGWAVWFPGRVAYDSQRFKSVVDAAVRAKELSTTTKGPSDER